MFLRQLDYKLFNLINGLAKRWRWLDYCGIFCAVYLIWFMAVISLIFFWYLPTQINRLRYLFTLFASTVGAYALSAAIGFAYGRARPFVDLEGARQLITTSFFHKSFPSSHATVAFALAFTVLWFNRPWGIVMLVLAALVAWGRVFVGVHYPMDVAAGAILGGAVSYIMYRIIM